MTTKHSRRPDGSETTDEAVQANAEAQPSAANPEADAKPKMTVDVERKIAIAKELGAMADRLNKMQHHDYDVSVANALKAVEQARIALQPQPPVGPDGQPIPPPQPQAESTSTVL